MPLVIFMFFMVVIFVWDKVDIYFCKQRKKANDEKRKHWSKD